MHIAVNPRFVRVRGSERASRFEPIARVREQLLLELIGAVGHHAVRPGIIRFD